MADQFQFNYCPVCGAKGRIKLKYNPELKEFILHCSRCSTVIMKLTEKVI